MSRTTRATAVGGLICLALLLLLPLPVALAEGGAGTGGTGGAGWGGGSLGGGGVTVGVGVDDNQPAPTGHSVQPALPPRYEYSTVPCDECVIDGEVCYPDGQLGLVPVQPGEDTAEALPPGFTVPLLVIIVSSATHQFIGYAGQTICVRAAQPPPAPTPAAVWASVPLPEAQISFDPATYGVTQLQTWFWLANDLEKVDVTVAVPGGVGGYSVTATVHPVAYDWTFGDGTGEVSFTGGPGAAAGAAATHTYTEPGTYSVGVAVQWAGSYTFAGYGVDQTVPLGPVSQAETVRAYQVQQIRSLLLPPPSGQGTVPS